MKALVNCEVLGKETVRTKRQLTISGNMYVSLSCFSFPRKYHEVPIVDSRYMRHIYIV